MATISGNITPIRTLLRRAVGTSFHVIPKLYGLRSFSIEMAKALRDVKRVNMIVGESIRFPGHAHTYPRIGQALSVRKIKNIQFDYLQKTISFFIENDDLIDRLLAKAIRTSLRDLATYGVPREAKEGIIEKQGGNQNQKILCYIEISPVNETSVEIQIGIS